MKRRTIPEIRDAMYTIAHVMKDMGYTKLAKEMINLANETRRVYIKKRAPNECQVVTPKIKAKIIQYYKFNPRKSVRHIANVFDVNQGRVSEIIGGKI